MAFGIDFGTTNSAVVFDETTLLRGPSQGPIPTAVAINRDTGKVICGDDVKQQQEELRDANYEVVLSVKTQFGTDHRWNTPGRSWTPVDIAEVFFRHLVEHVRSTVARGLDEAVVSIPVGFSRSKRQSLREAARRAGVLITDFVSEPTAAFFRYRRDLGNCSTLAVFDWGGGTLDVSVLSVGGGQIRELAVDGMAIAGDAIDTHIAEWAHRQLTREMTDPPAFKHVAPRDRDRLRHRCETAKRALSHDREATITVPGYLGETAPSVKLDRPLLAELVSPIVDSGVEVLRRALTSARVGTRVVDQIVLVGGSSHLVSVHERLEELFPGRIFRGKEPEWAVAQGASALANKPGRFKVLDRIELRLADDTALPLVHPGDDFDGQEHRHVLGIVEDSQSAELVFSRTRDLESSTQGGSGTENIGYLSVPMQGFHRERLDLDTTLTRDLTFRAMARSHSGNGEDAREFEYERLRFTYDLGE
ncbi:MAG: Hsp70 family protein [Phycisphaerales bacterium]